MAGKGNPRINCRVSYAEFITIQEEARKEHISVSDFIRNAIRYYFLYKNSDQFR